MLPDTTLPLPASLMTLLAAFGPLFTAPSFRTFCGLACGFWVQAWKRLIRDRSRSGCDLALVTTDQNASAAQVIERYASRWSIETAIEDAKQVFGTGQARNRAAQAVRRTVPFQLACQSIAITWYATAGHDPGDVDGHRARAPWYVTKARPSTADMTGKLRRVLIAARFKPSRPDQPTREEINAIRLAWEDAAA